MDTARENITREVGSRIRYARKSRGMSMDELAQAIYKTRSPSPSTRTDRSPWILPRFTTSPTP
jgi:hypothetical protein